MWWADPWYQSQSSAQAMWTETWKGVGNQMNGEVWLEQKEEFYRGK